MGRSAPVAGRTSGEAGCSSAARVHLTVEPAQPESGREAAWQALRQHVEWTPGFWIGWGILSFTEDLVGDAVSAEQHLREAQEPSFG